MRLTVDYEIETIKTHVLLSVQPMPSKPIRVRQEVLDGYRKEFDSSRRLSWPSLIEAGLDAYLRLSLSDERGIVENDKQIAEKFVEQILDGLNNKWPIATMWTLDWEESILRAYITDVFPQERKRLLDGLKIRRIMAYRPLIEILRHIALHVDVFKRASNYNLYVPRPASQADSLTDILDSGSLCPRIEIVATGASKGSFAFPLQSKGMRGYQHSEIGGMVQGLHEALYDWLVTDIESIHDSDSLRLWLRSVRKALKGLKHLSKEDKAEMTRVRNVIRVIEDGLSTDVEPGLDEKWWDVTAPIYEEHFLEIENPFLQTYFDQEATAIKKTLGEFVGSATGTGKKLAVLEVGCGTGRFLTGCAEKHPNQVGCIIGMDFSAKMLDLTKQEIAQHRNNGTNHVQYAFLKEKADKLHEHMKDGQILEGSRWKCSDLQKVNAFLEEHRRLVCLLNVLPNVGPRKRHDVLKSVRDSLRRGDRLFVSAYNRAHFAEQAYDLYADRRVAKISGTAVLHYDPDAGDYVSLSEDDGRRFYTHWFDETELRELLEGRDVGLAEVRRVPHNQNSNEPNGIFFIGEIR